MQSQVHKLYGLPTIEDNIVEGFIIKAIPEIKNKFGERFIIKYKTKKFSEIENAV